MRYSSSAHKLADKATVGQMRGTLERVLTPRDALREETSAPLRDFADLIKRLSQEIDETVLPRRFVLLSDAGSEATFVVSNRRLVELEIGDKKIEFGIETNTDADTVARVYAKALRALSLRSGPLRLRPIGRALNVATQGTTCTARHIAEFNSQSRFENRLKAFLKGTHQNSLGWLYESSDGQTVTHDPDKTVIEMLQRLKDAAMSKTERHSPIRSIETLSVPTCSTFTIAPDVQVLIAEDGKDRLFAAFPASDQVMVLKKWHRVFGRSAP